jgi:hypothetical protein
MIRIFTALIVGLLLFTSCDKSHESDLYGKDKPLKVMDKEGTVLPLSSFHKVSAFILLSRSVPLYRHLQS